MAVLVLVRSHLSTWGLGLCAATVTSAALDMFRSLGLLSAAHSKQDKGFPQSIARHPTPNFHMLPGVVLVDAISAPLSCRAVFNASLGCCDPFKSLLPSGFCMCQKVVRFWAVLLMRKGGRAVRHAADALVGSVQRNGGGV